jgi:hypothetical protein
MEFHFIHVTRGGYTTITDPNGIPRILCFNDARIARNCVRYICRYRSSYGVWPNFNLDSPIARIFPDKNAKHRTPDEIGKYIHVVEKLYDDLDSMSIETGVSYFYCHDFDYKEDLLRINLKGQQIDGMADQVAYKKRLEYRLKNV